MVIEYTPPIKTVKVEFDEQKFRNLTENFMSSGEYCEISDYACYDDWEYDIILELLYDNCLFTPEWSKVVFTLDEVVTKYLNEPCDEFVERVYDVCGNIIRDVLKANKRSGWYGRGLRKEI